MSTVPSNIIGNAPEITCTVNGVDALALIDTGSQVTSCSYSWFQKHFSDSKLLDISKLLRIESVSGEQLPYHGYFECNISVPVSDTLKLDLMVPVLVVPETSFNRDVPMLLGTNVLNHLVKFANKSNIPVIQLAIHSISLGQRHLAKTNGIYGHVTAEENIVLKPYTGVISQGKAVITIPICKQSALILEDDFCSVVPGLVNIAQGLNSVPVELFNDSENQVHISKGDKIANIHQASIELNQTEVDHTDFFNAFDLKHLDDDQAVKLKKFLAENRDVFAMSISEMGCTNITEHRIELLDETPFKEKLRPIPPGMYDELRSHIAELLSAGVIETSNSPFSSNIVLVRKKDNSLRMCVDYRTLNSRTKRDCYTIPRVEPLIDSLKDAKYFCSLDMISGYNQVAVAEEHKERTAFITPCGFYQMRKMPFGLSNSPSTFQRMVEKVLDGLMTVCTVFLDDILVHGKTENEMYVNLSLVFDRLRQAGLKLKPKKCRFFQSSIDYLGFTVSPEGVRCSDQHIEDVKKWIEPTNVKELQSFLGFANFHRRFIAGFAQIAEPLTKLLRGHTNVKRSHAKKTNKSKNVSDPEPWKWDQEQQSAFDNLKTALTTPPCLSYPDFQKPFQLHVDASRVALGAALYQQDDQGKSHPIAFGSRVLNAAERNYSAHKLEFLALKWAISVKFAYYLYGSKHRFDVFTDHNPLLYLTTTAKLDALGHRWLAELAPYHFRIFYKPGFRNTVADSLSRIPHSEEECTSQVSEEVLQELCKMLTCDNFSGFAEVSHVSPTAISSAIHVSSHAERVDWLVEQGRDSDVARVRELVVRGHRVSDRLRKRETKSVQKLLHYFKKLVVKDGLLYMKSTNQKTGECLFRLIIPKHKQDHVLKLSHHELGHLGRDKTLSIAQDRYFWIGLSKDVDEMIKSCLRCQCAKKPHLPERAPLVSVTTTRPLELVCMDFLSLEESKGKYSSILVITDHFTGYAIAVPTRNQEAKTVAKCLVEHFIVHYGIPERLHSDQGGSFMGRVITHMCRLLNISKSNTTIFHPQGNSKPERFNRSLLGMLRTLEPQQKADWKEHVFALVHAYNSCRHSTTGLSPFYLMFGRPSRLAIDVFLGIPEPEGMNSTASSIRERLKVAYQIASDAAKKAQVIQAKHYNKKVRGTKIEIGDFVLAKNVNLRGKHKLADRWSDKMYIVVAQPNVDIPVYVIRAEDGSGEKVLHRNMLLPLILPWPDRDDVNDSVEDNIDDDIDFSDNQSDIEVQVATKQLAMPRYC